MSLPLCEARNEVETLALLLMSTWLHVHHINFNVLFAVVFFLLICAHGVLQSQKDGSNEPGADEKPSVAITNSIAGEVANGYTINVHNGDLAYAE